MRVCKVWRTIALESVVQNCETVVPPGYFGSFDRQKDLAVQLLQFRTKVFKFFPSGLPIYKSGLDRSHTLAFLACQIVYSNLKEFAINYSGVLDNDIKRINESLNEQASDKNSTPDLVPLRESLKQVGYICLNEIEMILPELLNCYSLEIKSTQLQTLEHCPTRLVSLTLQCDNSPRILVTLPYLNALTELTLVGTVIPEGTSRLTSLKVLQVSRRSCSEEKRSYPKLTGLEQLKYLNRLSYLGFLGLKTKMDKETLVYLTSLQVLKLGLSKLSFSECSIPPKLAEVAIWNCQIKNFTLSIPHPNQLRQLSISTFNQVWNPPQDLLTQLKALPNLEFTYIPPDNP